MWVRPFSKDLKGWCRAHYSETFDNPRTTTKKPSQVPYEKLKSFVDQGDMTKVASILSSNGWPSDTDFQKIVPSVLNLYLMHETWKNARKMLENLASFSSDWEVDPAKTPVKNFHLLSVLRRLAEEEETISIREITDFAYELRTLFPNGKKQNFTNAASFDCFSHLSLWRILRNADRIQKVVCQVFRTTR